MAGVAKVLSDKTDYLKNCHKETNSLQNDKLIHQEDDNFKYYAPKNSATKYRKQVISEMKTEKETQC